jgi:hypothetical protein
MIDGFRSLSQDRHEQSSALKAAASMTDVLVRTDIAQEDGAMVCTADPWIAPAPAVTGSGPRGEASTASGCTNKLS